MHRDSNRTIILNGWTLSLLFNFLMAFVMSYMYEMAARLLESWISHVTFFLLVGFCMFLILRAVHLLGTWLINGGYFKAKLLFQIVLFFASTAYWLAAFMAAGYLDSEKPLSPLFLWIVKLQHLLFR
jgi:hypothetical protein